MQVGIRPYVIAVSVLLGVVFPRSTAADPISLITNSNLGFGQAVATFTAGSVIVTPGGGRSATGGVILGNSFGASSASFTVTGDLGTTYSISLPGSCTLTGSSSTMSADTFESLPSGSGNLGTGGTQTLTVGATLRIGAPQAPGAYSGTYVVAVAYN